MNYKTNNCTFTDAYTGVMHDGDRFVVGGTNGSLKYFSTVDNAVKFSVGKALKVMADNGKTKDVKNYVTVALTVRTTDLFDRIDFGVYARTVGWNVSRDDINTMTATVTKAPSRCVRMAYLVKGINSLEIVSVKVNDKVFSTIQDADRYIKKLTAGNNHGGERSADKYGKTKKK